MNRLSALLLCLLMLLCAAPALAGVSDFAVVHNPDPADRLNLRKNAITESVSLGKFYNGTPVFIEAIYGDWAKVTLQRGLTGYMRTEFLAMGEEAETIESAMPVVTVTAPMGKTIYDGMLASSAAVATLYPGAQMEVMGVMEDWLFVRTGEPVVGFTQNSGTLPRVSFSAPQETPRIPVFATPTPSPTPLPRAADGQAYARVTLETALYADEALTMPLRALAAGTVLPVDPSGGFVCRTSAGGQDGFVSASFLAFGAEPDHAASAPPVEGERGVSPDDRIIFAAVQQDTTLYADRALTQPIGVLRRGELVRMLNGFRPCATYIRDMRIAGYFSVQDDPLNVTFGMTYWPFHVQTPSAVVDNPVGSDRLHLRESPSQDAQSLGRYYNGTVVTLLDNFDGRKAWTHVDIGGVTGYMMSRYLTFSPDLDEVFPAISLYEIANTAAGNLHLRAAPSADAASLGLYEHGTLVAVIGVTGDWAHVICEGQTGFMLHRSFYTSEGAQFNPYP